MKLLSIQNAKTVKGNQYGYLTGILYLASGSVSGFKVCPNSNEECEKHCLYYAGRVKFSSVQKARIRKTLYFFENRQSFLDDLVSDIKYLVKKSQKLNLKLCIRLNGTSDLNFKKFKVNNQYLYEIFPDVIFYDYTKMYSYIFPKDNNWHYTYSYDGINWDICEQYLNAGGNVSKIFYSELPKQYKGFDVIEGYNSDLRFLDPPGTIIGLKFKKVPDYKNITLHTNYIENKNVV